MGKNNNVEDEALKMFNQFIQYFIRISRYLVL